MGRKKIELADRGLLFVKRQNKLYVDMYRGVFNGKKVTINYGWIILENRDSILGYSSPEDKSYRKSIKFSKLQKMLVGNNALSNSSSEKERLAKINQLQSKINLPRPKKDYLDVAFNSYKAAFSTSAQYCFIPNEKILPKKVSYISSYIAKVLNDALNKAQAIKECSVLAEKIQLYIDYISPIINVLNDCNFNNVLEEIDLEEIENNCKDIKLFQMLTSIEVSSNSYIRDKQTEDLAFAFTILKDALQPRDYCKIEESTSDEIKSSNQYIFNKFRYLKDLLLSPKAQKAIQDKLDELNEQLIIDKEKYVEESLAVMQEFVHSTKNIIDYENRKRLIVIAKQILNDLEE